MVRPFMKHLCCSRRQFLRIGAAAAAATQLPFHLRAEEPPPRRRNAAVSITSCRTYNVADVRAALDKNFDLIGGIGSLVKNKTVTVKLNLTGSMFDPFLGRPPGETFITHPSTGAALAAALFAAGARRVRFVESTNLKEPLATTLRRTGWDVTALQSLGKMEFENTRNLGFGKNYATLKVPGGGHLFSSFDLNRSYHDTDVFVSLCKLKLHATAGVTLTMKNLFGITPNSLYGDEAPDENGTQGRGKIHDLTGWEPARQNVMPYDPPGATRRFFETRDGTMRIPRVVSEICGARPIHLGIIDGITSMNVAEGPWCPGPKKFVSPGVIIAGVDPVATDAVGTAVMGFDNPRAPRGTVPFDFCDNHLLLAEQAGLGTADLSRIDVAGVPLATARSKEYRS
jgi:uncharacterized protein (DUF362 family)